MWPSISESKLLDDVSRAEYYLTGHLKNFWEFIKIRPEKWQEESLGKDSHGFWAVAVFGKNVLWYNDIEEGYNISKYRDYGLIDDYKANQSDLYEIIESLYKTIQSG